MPEEYEIRGAHEDHVDARAEHGDGLAQQIALFSAVAATLGAVVSLFGGHAQNDSLYYKNEAVLMKARASDQWAYFQAEQLKGLVIGTAAPAAADTAGKVAHYAERAKKLKAEAEGFDRKSEEANRESENALKPHIKLSVAMTFVQIAIALASITALTRKRWLFGVAAAAALVGVVLAAIAWS